ncbi:MAG: LolA-like outer membrane lipoprotein chaperone [Campylobacterota bacterium]|nr:LolA-like outer membrane lipoprotein chaperone [Campylobacterota bacterium]
MKFFRLLIFLILISSNITLANSFKNTNSFQAIFKQSIVNNSGNEVVYKGTIKIKRPNSMLWLYKDPIEKYVYILKQNVTIIEPELEQAIVTKLENELNIIQLLNEAKKIKNNLYKSELFNKEYFLTIKENKLTKIEYKDELENNVTISFTNILINKIINDKQFKFIIPSGFDIIKK